MMAKKEEENLVVAAIKNLENKINILIAFNAIQAKQSSEKNIQMFAKMGISYNEIEKILGVSSATIAKVLKKK
jgi:uncharacterized protein YerC